ncbi:MAG: hypothetical protein ACQETR_11440 [Thermodesulfobacteriota bacterium]
MKVLVTGGVIGLHLVRALAQRGDDVTVLDISEGDPADAAGLKDQGVHFIKGSVLERLSFLSRTCLICNPVFREVRILES